MLIANELSHIWATVAPAAANHIWQSTAFAGVAAGVALALGKCHARVRYWVWLAASAKFLVPFSLLFTLGSYLAIPKAAAPSSSSGGLSAAVHEVATVGGFLTVGFSGPAINTAAAGRGYQPIHLLPMILIGVWLCGFVAVLCLWFVRWRRMSRICRDAMPLREGREVNALRGVERISGVREPLAIRLSRGSLEPGIFGIVRPVLVWPEGVSARLDDAQLRAIMAHEMWHVRRRDNLAAALHMFIEAIFWFHPLVWWLGGRLVDERERSCDEGVLQTGSEPKVYAESILKACEFSVESPLACVSGVTGSDLKKRIVRIMTERISLKVSARQKLLLAVIGFLAIAAPIGFGLAHGKPGHTNQSAAPPQAAHTTATRPKFEVASIKPNRSGDDNMKLLMSPSGRFSANAVSTKTLIELAYHLKSDGQIVGAPSWVNTEKFDIEAKANDAFVQKMRKMSFDEGGQQMRLMVQSLLANRFDLKVSRETQERPVYALVVAKNGPKLTPTKLPPPGQMGANPPGPPGHGGRVGEGVRMQPGQLTCMGVATSFIAEVLSRQPELAGRIVIDETGLKGRYDGTLKWTPEFQRGGMAGGPGPAEGPGLGGAPGENGQAADGTGADASGPSLFTALQQQLGLRLKPTKGPVEVLVIDHIERPTPN